MSATGALPFPDKPDMMTYQEVQIWMRRKMKYNKETDADISSQGTISLYKTQSVGLTCAAGLYQPWQYANCG